MAGASETWLKELMQMIFRVAEDKGKTAEGPGFELTGCIVMQTLTPLDARDQAARKESDMPSFLEQPTHLLSFSSARFHTSSIKHPDGNVWIRNCRRGPRGHPHRH
jgi:hypothetical protein